MLYSFMPKKSEKEFLKEKLSILLDLAIILFVWALLVFDVIGFLYTYTTFDSSYTGYAFNGLNKGLLLAFQKITEAIFRLGSISVAITIIYLLDRRLASEKLKSTKVRARTFATSRKNTYRMSLRAKILLSVVVFVSIPWILAVPGIFVSDIPVLNIFFIGSQDYGGKPSVHLGTHHGFEGFFTVTAMILVFTTAKYLYDKRLKIIAGLGASFLLVLGLYNLIEDFFVEQIYKRGLITTNFLPYPGSNPEFVIS